MFRFTTAGYVGKFSLSMSMHIKKIEFDETIEEIKLKKIPAAKFLHPLPQCRCMLVHPRPEEHEAFMSRS